MREPYNPAYSVLAEMLHHERGELYYELGEGEKSYKLVVKRIGPFHDEPDELWARCIHLGEVIAEDSFYTVEDALDWLCDTTSQIEGGWQWN